MKKVALNQWLVLLTVLLLGTQCVFAQLKTKKLIEFGWDRPLPSYVVGHISVMEQLPFDGTVMNIPKIYKVMAGRQWSKADAPIEFAALPKIKWNKFTDNFILLNMSGTIDWYNNRDWAIVLSNVKLIAEAARLGNCRGILFDAEPYAVTSPWQYNVQARANRKSFIEYKAQVRLRGRQFMDAIQSQLPSPVILGTFFTSILSNSNRLSLSTAKYGMVPNFLDGMLDIANPGAVIVDGDEAAYGYESEVAFSSSNKRVQQDALTLLSPENLASFNMHVQCGQCVFPDRLFGLQGPDTVAYYLTPADQLQWFSANLYYAFKYSDEYVWLYSNKPNWWENRDLPTPTIVETIETIRNLDLLGLPLGFDIPDSVQAARQTLEAIKAQ